MPSVRRAPRKIGTVGSVSEGEIENRDAPVALEDSRIFRETAPLQVVSLEAAFAPAVPPVDMQSTSSDAKHSAHCAALFHDLKQNATESIRPGEAIERVRKAPPPLRGNLDDMKSQVCRLYFDAVSQGETTSSFKDACEETPHLTVAVGDEALQRLHSVRDDILCEMRNMQSNLLAELQAVKKEAAKAQASVVGATFPYRVCHNRVAEGGHEEVMEKGRGFMGTSEASSMEYSLQSPHSKSMGQASSMESQNWRPSGESDETFAARLQAEATIRDLRNRISRGGNQDKPSRVLTAESVKENYRKMKLKHHYNVKNMYHETGFSQKVARHVWFEHVTVAVIVTNAIWMYVETDLSDADSITTADFVYVLADALFYSYYVVELLIRFLAFKRKRDCAKDGWFVFDSILVILYTIDPFVIGIVQHAFGVGKDRRLDLPTEVLRLIRLARLFRLSKLLEAFPEMLIMIKGIVTALGTVGYTISLLGLITYVFAIALRNLVPADSQIKTMYFPTVLETMHHLIIYGTFVDDLSGFILLVKRDSVPCFVLAWLYIAVSSLLILNTLIGLVCEVIGSVAAEEREGILIGKVNDRFRKLLVEFDTDEDGLLSWKEFANLIATDACQLALKRFGVDVEALVDMVEDIFIDSPVQQTAITDDRVIEMILDLRGAQNASVKDIMNIGKRINARFRELKERLGLFDQILQHEDPKS